MTIITQKKLKFKIPDGKKKERIDTFLSNSIENITRSRIQKLIKEDLVKVNDIPVKANYRVVPDDDIEVIIPVTPRPDNIEPENIPLDINYEDDYLIIVNKPAGMVVHPAVGNYTGTLVHALLYYTQNLSMLNEEGRAGLVHRIDKDTSGLLVIAKDEWVHAKLAADFAKHNIQREYWAVCWGRFEKRKGEIIGNIARSKSDRKKFTVSESEGKHAHTFYEVIEEFEFMSLVKLKLKTGRTHQIRVHLSSINHPIFGDETYGGRRIHTGMNLTKMRYIVNKLLEIMPRQALHAKTLGFNHPKTNEELFFDSDLPEDFKNLLQVLKTNQY
ncbi:ribosomal large subunit pseudouridine synthase D [bacterium BMS3Abin04]|nr:ribosomal large subunit pseudouridine synthase D [bacterium BMS3Abin04]